MIRFPRASLRQLVRDESGQATTEYILMMAIAVSLVVSVLKKIVQPSLDRLMTSISNRMDKMIFGGAGFHHINVGGGAGR